MTAGGIAVSRPADRVRRRRNLAFAVAKYAFLGFWALLCLLPMILIFSTAFKDPTIETGNPFQLFSSVRFENLVDAWTLGNFGRYFMNTIVIMVPVVLGVVALEDVLEELVGEIRDAAQQSRPHDEPEDR